MASAALTEDYSCGYCLQRLTYMTDPRELPCSHIFCLPCIQADYEKLGRVECAVCGKAQEIASFETLSKVKVMTVGKTEESDSIPCDVCTGDKQRAVTFCQDCMKKMCAEHFKTHEEFEKTFSVIAHSTLTIREYAENFTRYQREQCKDHETEYRQLACSMCCQTFCVKCETDGFCEMADEVTKADVPHTIVSLETFADDTREEIKASMMSLSCKLSEISKKEKEAWIGIAGIENRAVEMVKEVEILAEEQIENINRQREAAKDGIYKNLSSNVAQAENYSAMVLEIREQLENLWRTSNRFLAHSNHVAVVTKGIESISKLKDAVNKNIQPCQLFKGKFQKDAMMFIQDCSSSAALRFVKQLTSGYCSSTVCWMENGSLLSGGGSNLHQYDTESGSIITQVNQKKYIGSVAVGKNVIAGISSTNDGGGSPVFMLFSEDLKLQNTVAGFSFTSSYMNNLVTVMPGTSSIIILNPNTKQVLLYSSKGGLICTVKLIGLQNPTAIHALPDQSVVVSDYNIGSVSKFRLANQKLEHLWTYIGVINPTALSVDLKGWIYCLALINNPATANQIPAINIISEEGKLLQSLTHQKLPSSTNYRCDIAVSADGTQLAVACYGNGVALFDLVKPEI